MEHYDTNIVKKAEELEERSKIETKNKNYDAAINLLLEAKDLYTKLGLTGQVGIIIKEVVHLKNLKSEQPSLAKSSANDKVPTYEKLKPTPHFEESKLREMKTDNMIEPKGVQLLENARSAALNENYEEALKIYDEAYSVFKKLNHPYECKQILWQINEIKEYQRWEQSNKSKGIKVALKDIVTLAAAEKRRLTIQKRIEEPKKTEPIKIESKKIELEKDQPKLFQQLHEKAKQEEIRKRTELSLIQEQKEQRKQRIEAQQEKLRNIQEEKLKEEVMVRTAEDLLDKGNLNLQKKLYDEARSSYEQAIKIFSSIGWFNQVKILQNEIRNIDLYRKEEERKVQLATVIKQQSQQQFQKRVDTMINEQERLQERERDRMEKLSPDIKMKLEKALLIKQKAEMEEKMNKIPRVIKRYEYLLQLYNSIPTNFIDLSEEISSTEKIISELKKKL